MEIVTLVAIGTVILGIATKLIGFPDQIHQNFKRKSTRGLSATLMFFTFFSYLLWTWHGFLQHDWVLIWGQALGVIMAGIILVQITLYRPKHRSS